MYPNRGAIWYLSGCQELQEVNLEGCLNLTDATARHLSQCARLQSISFQGCGHLSDVAAEQLSGCPQLWLALALL